MIEPVEFSPAYPAHGRVARDGKCVSKRGRTRPAGGTMFDMHWSVAMIPIVGVGVLIFALISRRHKEKKASDHMLKLD